MAIPTPPRYNTLNSRLFAGFIDTLVVMGFVVIDGLIYEMDIRWLTLLWMPIAFSSSWLYFVIGHRLYGKTFGKLLMKISVVDNETEGPITWTQALLRESFYIVLNVYALLVNLHLVFYEVSETSLYIEIAALIISFSPIVWFLIEVISALSNWKRRAVHDLIAGTVVVNDASPRP